MTFLNEFMKKEVIKKYGNGMQFVRFLNCELGAFLRHSFHTGRFLHLWSRPLLSVEHNEKKGKYHERRIKIASSDETADSA
jgi:hypothetical protein